MINSLSAMSENALYTLPGNSNRHGTREDHISISCVHEKLTKSTRTALTSLTSAPPSSWPRKTLLYVTVVKFPQKIPGAECRSRWLPLSTIWWSLPYMSTHLG